jgi:hypothetical protein
MAEGDQGSLPKAHDHYHAGIVSDDPAATMARLTKLLGYQWADPIGGPVSVSFPGDPREDGSKDGDTTVEIRAWYSVTTPRLEVVQSIPGTVWSRADSGLHHFGYWVDDVAATIDALEAGGYVREAVGKLPDGQPYWAYLSSPAGPRLEVVSRQLQPMMERYFTTGSVA